MEIEWRPSEPFSWVALWNMIESTHATWKNHHLELSLSIVSNLLVWRLEKKVTIIIIPPNGGSKWWFTFLKYIQKITNKTKQKCSASHKLNPVNPKTNNNHPSSRTKTSHVKQVWEILEKHSDQSRGGLRAMSLSPNPGSDQRRLDQRQPIPHLLWSEGQV